MGKTHHWISAAAAALLVASTVAHAQAPAPAPDGAPVGREAPAGVTSPDPAAPLERSSVPDKRDEATDTTNTSDQKPTVPPVPSDDAVPVDAKRQVPGTAPDDGAGEAGKAR